jgi:hypothetical protein
MRYLPRLLQTLSTATVLALSAASSADERVLFSPTGANDIADLRGRTLVDAQARGGVDSLDARPEERLLRQHTTVAIGKGDFTLRATVVLDDFAGKGAGLVFDGSAIVLDDPEWGAVLTGRAFGGGRFPFEVGRPAAAVPGAPIAIEVQRADGMLMIRLNELEVGRIGMNDLSLGRLGFDLGLGRMRLIDCSVEGDVSDAARPRAVFTSADGDIDEFREPSAASDGTRVLVTAVGVLTAEDGSARTELHGRFREADGSLSAPFRIDVGDIKPDIVCIGYAAGQPRPWRAVVQEVAPRRLVESLVVLDSDDGRVFSRRGVVASSGAPIQLLPGSMHRSQSALMQGATRLFDGAARAAAVEVPDLGDALLRELHAEPACEPFWLDGARAMVRRPREGARDAILDGVRTQTTGFDAAAVAAWCLEATAAGYRVAAAEPAFPSPLRELGSTDGGATWTPTRILWGSAAGHACGARVRSGALLVFEGGDKARREHVLMLAPAAAPPLTSPSPSPSPAPSAPIAPK